MKVRTRFAPSPTGPLHMGNARTALFNYLFAKKKGGVFLLRVEDTDKERSEKRWEEDMLTNLAWLGLKYDGDLVRQSERTNIYKQHLQKLLEEGKAYWCFCTQEELEAQHQDQASRGEAPHYTGTCRQLSKEERQNRLAAGERAVIRFMVAPKPVTFKDLIREEVTFDMALSGDIVIAKDLETPLYNFTVVVDDEEMEITHVIRGEDHIANTPKQLLIKEALEFKGKIEYAHLPLILGEDRTKLSKRHGDMSVTRFKDEGYLPEAVTNFLALLGWNPGDEREIFSLQQLEKEFSLEQVQKGGAIFNIQRLDWINGKHIRQVPLKKLVKKSVPYLIEAGLLQIEWPDVENKEFWHLPDEKDITNIITEERLQELISFVRLYQDRIKKLSEIPELIDFFLKEPEYEKNLLSWKGMADEEVKDSLQTTENLLSQVDEKEWTKENVESLLMPVAEQAGDRGKLLWPLRAALTGKKASAGPFEIAALLGKTKALERIQQAKAKLE